MLNEILKFQPILLLSALVAFGVNYVVSRWQEVSTHSRRSNASAPVEPPVVPCWIPYLGSAMEMGQDILGFIRKYSSRYSTPIFSATISGEVCHFLADSSLDTIPFQATTALNHDTQVKNFLVRAVGADLDSVTRLFQQPELSKKFASILQQHIRSRKSTESSLQRAQTILRERLDYLHAKHSSEKEWFSVPLYQFCLENVFIATVQPILSDSLGNVENAHAFHDFSLATPSLLGGMPSFLVRQGVRGRKFLQQKYLHEAATDTLRPVLRKQRELLLMMASHDPNLSIDTAVELIFSVAGNSIPAVFWALCNILRDPDALAAVQAEVESATAASGDGFLSMETLEGLSVLQSIWTETLRMYFAAFATRDVVEDHVVEASGQKYLLKKGTRVMGYTAYRHHDAAIFANPETFVWNRFYTPSGEPAPEFRLKDGTVLKEPVSSFGGGPRKCPGQAFIENEAKALLFMLFRRFDIRLVQDVPKVEPSTQGLGVVQPAHDVLVEMRVR